MEDRTRRSINWISTNDSWNPQQHKANISRLLRAESIIQPILFRLYRQNRRLPLGCKPALTVRAIVEPSLISPVDIQRHCLLWLSGRWMDIPPLATSRYEKDPVSGCALPDAGRSIPSVAYNLTHSRLISFSDTFSDVCTYFLQRPQTSGNIEFLRAVYYNRFSYLSCSSAVSRRCIPFCNPHFFGSRELPPSR